MLNLAAIYTSLLTVELVMALALLVFWLTTKRHPGVIQLSVSIFLASLGGFLVIVAANAANPVAIHIAATSYVISVVFAARAMSLLQNRRPDYLLESFCVLSTLSVLIWFFVVGLNIEIMVILHSILYAVISYSTAKHLICEKRSDMKPGCRFLGFVFAFFAIFMTFRAINITLTGETLTLQPTLQPVEIVAAFFAMVVAICWSLGMLWTIYHSAEYRLKVKNDALERFTRAVAHDLKSPLNSISGYLGMVKYKIDVQRTDEFVDHALGGAERMSTFIDQLLADAHKAHEDNALDPVDPKMCCEIAWKNLSALAQKTKADINIGKLPLVLGNELHLIRVFQNIFDNSMKYHDANRPPKITVSCEIKNGFAVFSLQDNGMGIKKTAQIKIFDDFERNAAPENIGGNGVGLAECKRIIQRFGGKIWVKSKPGQGSTFYFSLMIVNA